MAAYYVRHRPRSVSRASSRVFENGPSGVQEERTLPNISSDRSIYIFPSPPSAPASPVSPGSSLFSVPSDFEASESFSFRTRSRASSTATRTLGSDLGGGAGITRQRISQISDNEVEIDVELWELSTDYDRVADLSDTEESWVLEDEVERVSAGDLDVSFRPQRRTTRLSSPLSPDSIQSRHYWVVRPQRRARSHSRLRTISSLSSALSSPSARRSAPHPRIHIPLLSFFSSLLSVDLEDPALRLLTHVDPSEGEAVLFPGHTTTQLLSSDKAPVRDCESDADVDTDSTVSDEEGEHGLPRLLLASLSDQSTTALRSLRAGLAVCIPHPPELALPIPIPGASGLYDLWRVVGEVCVRSTQAWKEVWGGGLGVDEEDSILLDS